MDGYARHHPTEERGKGIIERRRAIASRNQWDRCPLGICKSIFLHWHARHIGPNAHAAAGWTGAECSIQVGFLHPIWTTVLPATYFQIRKTARALSKQNIIKNFGYLYRNKRNRVNFVDVYDCILTMGSNREI